jgi:hypothetical protein
MGASARKRKILTFKGLDPLMSSSHQIALLFFGESTTYIIPYVARRQINARE